MEIKPVFKTHSVSVVDKIQNNGLKQCHAVIKNLLYLSQLFESLYQDCTAPGGRMINECGSVGRMRFGGGNHNQRKPSPLLLLLCLSQVVHDLTWDQTRTAGFELNLVFTALIIENQCGLCFIQLNTLTDVFTTLKSFPFRL
jgi:hypothetical protein